MEPAHERTYRQLVRRLQQPNPRPGVIWVACADLSLRAEIEARLRVDLGISELAVVTWDSHPTAPWDEILAAWDEATNERRPVVVHYDAIEAPPIDLSQFDSTPSNETLFSRALLQLNVGRDRGVRCGAVVLLWIRGLGPLEVVQNGAPDLWAHRLLVCRFSSTADFLLLEGAHFNGGDSANKDAQIARLEAELEVPWTSAPGRLEQLDTLVIHLCNDERWGEMLRRLEELRALYEVEGLGRDPLYAAGMLNREMFVASRFRDVDRLEALLGGSEVGRSKASPWLDLAIAIGHSHLYEQQGRDAEALQQYEKRLAADDEIKAAQGRNFAIPGASTLVARAEHFLYELELPLRAIIDAQGVERLVADAVSVGPAHRHGFQGDAEIILAEARRRMGLVDEALALGWRAARRRTALGPWQSVQTAIGILQDIYLEMGLPGIPRTLWLYVLNTLESMPEYKKITEPSREIHQCLAELGMAIGDGQLVRCHGASALAELSRTEEIPSSLYCHRIRVRARHARKLRPHWHDSADLDDWAEALHALVQAPQTPAFHRDLLCMELARWRLAQQDLGAAASLAAEVLDYRSKHLGPRKIIDARILAAEIEQGRDEHASALAHLDAACEMLYAQPEQAQPFFLWSRLQRQLAALVHANGQPDAAWVAFDVLLEIADRRHLVPDGIELRLEQAETNLDHPKARDNADACLTRALELGYLRLEGRARLLLTELAWRRNDRDTARRELKTAVWLVDRLGPIEVQQRARVLNEKLRPQ